MRIPLPERFDQAPKRRNDVIRLIAGFSIVAAELSYRLEGGSYDAPRQAIIYSGAALALGLVAMPLNRFGENYYGNLRFKELDTSDSVDNPGLISTNGNQLGSNF